MHVARMQIRRRFVLITLVASSLTVVGCSRRMTKWEKLRPKTFKARGQVLWNGKPEAGVVVAMESKAHSHSAVGITDASGRFALKTFNEGDGAVPGEYAVRLKKTVVVTSESGTGDPGGRFGGGSTAVTREISVLPNKYGDFATSGLTAVVVEQGPNEFTFEIPGPRTVP